MNKNYFTLGSVSSVLALVILSMTLLAMGYILFIETPSLRYMNLPFPVLKSPVYPGDVLPFKVSRCSDADERRAVTSSRYMDNLNDDKEVLAIEMIAVFIPPGCVTQTVNIHRVPESTIPGNYRLIGATSVPGMIRDFQVNWYSEPFWVVAKPVAVPAANPAANLIDILPPHAHP